MKNKNDKRGKSPANFYDRIAEMLNKAAIPQTITVEAEGVSPETFLATGITKRELYATVAMASLAHAVVTTPPTGGGRLRSDWARRVGYTSRRAGLLPRRSTRRDRTKRRTRKRFKTMKILYLPLKKEWYEMIERGDKREEYRENTRYWKTRLIDTVIYDEGDEETESPVFIFFKDYDAVCFSYGYTRRRMLWECKGVDFGRGRPEWGAPDHETFIIKLGNRLNDERLQ